MGNTFIPFIPCDDCDNGYRYIRSKEKGNHAKRCSCYTKFLERRHLEIDLFSSGLSQSIYNYNINTYIGTKSLSEIKKVERYIKNFDSTFKSIHLYLYGTNGTQKTSLSQYIGRELLRQKFSVKYVLMNEMIKNLTKEGFEERVQYEIDKYYAVDCLIIDEAFDKEKILWYKSNFQLNFLDTLLRKRIDQLNKAIIFVSNKSVESIEANFNQSIYDLIQRNTRNSTLTFKDHYSLRNDFDSKDLWKD